MKEAGLDYKNLQNVLISFERDHAQLFSAEHYISHRDAQRLRDTYGKYNESLTNKLIFQYVYDKFCERFPWLAKVLPFETFSKYVDDALSEMKDVLKQNSAIASIVEPKEGEK